MKRTLLALCLALAVTAGLSGCGGKGPAPAPSALPSVDPQEVQRQQDDFDPRGTVLADENGLKITVDDLRQGEDAGVELDLELENTSQRDLTVSVASCSVNGYMAGAYFVSTVPAGGSALDTLSIYTDELAELGAADLADIAVSFSVDGQDGSHAPIGSRSLTMPLAALYDYSASLCRRAFTDPDWAEANGYQVLYAAPEPLYDQDGVSLLCAVLTRDVFGDLQLRLELENRDQDRALVEVGGISLNGVQLSEPDYGKYAIDPGKRYLTTVPLSFLIPDGAEEDYAQLRELGLTVNGTAVNVSIPQ